MIQYSKINKNLFSLSLYIFLFSLFLFLPIKHVNAIGVSPPTLTGISIPRNGIQTKQIRVLRGGDNKGNLKIKVEAMGENAEYIETSGDIIMISGKDFVDYEFTINPKNAPNGEHKARLSFISQGIVGEEKTKGASVQVFGGAVADIYFEVGGVEVIKYEIIKLFVKNTEVNKNTELSFEVNNTGNVNWKPERIDLQFTNINDSTEKIIHTIFSDAINIAKAGRFTEYVFNLDLPFIQSEYVLNAVFYAKDKEKTELTSNHFNVFAPDTLKQKGELKDVSLNKDVFSPDENIKVSGVFKNTGEIAVSGVLVVEVYLNNELTDLLKSSELDVSVLEEVIFSKVFTLKEIGNYKISAHIKYGNKQTVVLNKEFNVQNNNNDKVAITEIASKLNTYIGIGVLISIIIIITTIFILRRRKTVQFSEPEPVQGVQNNMIISELDDNSATENMTTDINVTNKETEISDNTIEPIKESVEKSDKVEFIQTEQSTIHESLGNSDEINNYESDSDDVNLLDQINTGNTSLDDK